MQQLTGTAGRPTAPRRGLAFGLPVVVLPGLVLMAGAFVADVVAHAGGLDSLEPAAHLAGVLGMVLVWLAVVVDGAHRTARPD